MFGLGVLEILILGLCCIGPVLSAAIVLLVVFVLSRKNAERPAKPDPGENDASDSDAEGPRE